MAKAIWTGLVLAHLAAVPAFADDNAATVASGQVGIVAQLALYDQNCAPQTPPTIKIVTPPAHGKAEIRMLSGKAGSGSRCAGTPIKINTVAYQSQPGFHGTDTVTISESWLTRSDSNIPTGGGQRTITITVK